MSALRDIQKKILSFRNERDWAQFHDPKNLAEALSIEAGELLENFLWKTTEQSRNLTAEELKNVKEELADIFIFLTYPSEEYDPGPMTLKSRRPDSAGVCEGVSISQQVKSDPNRPHTRTSRGICSLYQGAVFCHLQSMIFGPNSSTCNGIGAMSWAHWQVEV